MAKNGFLYVVATPIGNLADMSQRAIDTLQKVDLIAAEDTRHSMRLLQHYNIKTTVISLHQYNEQKRLDFFLSHLEKGNQVALISDAGTPLLSDPGYYLVNAVIQAGFNVIPIPGPCAAIAALVASGLPTDRFVFEGFLPPKGAVRVRRLEALIDEPRTLIFYESVHRILDLMDSLINVFGPEREGAVARELTKTFETIKQGRLIELKEWMQIDANQQKGEFVVLLKGAEPTPDELKLSEYRRVLEILLLELPLKQAVAIAEKITQGPHRLLYQLALSMKDLTNNEK